MDLDNEEKRFLKADEINFLNCKEFKFKNLIYLPCSPKENQVVEVMILSEMHYAISASSGYIRFGQKVGNTVIFSYSAESHSKDRNPKFVWDEERKCWILICHGPFYFAEQEVNSIKDAV